MEIKIDLFSAYVLMCRCFVSAWHCDTDTDIAYNDQL